jgi:hypothetical protein
MCIAIYTVHAIRCFCSEESPLSYIGHHQRYTLLRQREELVSGPNVLYLNNRSHGQSLSYTSGQTEPFAQYLFEKLDHWNLQLPPDLSCTVGPYQSTETGPPSTCGITWSLHISILVLKLLTADISAVSNFYLYLPELLSAATCQSYYQQLPARVAVSSYLQELLSAATCQS